MQFRIILVKLKYIFIPIKNILRANWKDYGSGTCSICHGDEYKFQVTGDWWFTSDS